VLHRILKGSLVRTGLLSAALVLATANGWAQTEQERAGARVAATEGYKAFFDQRWDDALDLFTRAESLVHAPPHLLYIARARDKLGQLVAAREAYMRVVKENIDPGAPKAFHDAQDSAKQELSAIENRIPSVTIKVKGAGAGEKVAVMVDDQQMPVALIGLPNPIDPGEHAFRVVADGKSSQLVKQTLAEAQKATIELELRADPNAVMPGGQRADPAAGAATPGAADTSTEGHLSVPTDTGPKGSSGNGLRIASYVAGGVGVLGLGVGVVFTLQSSSKRSDVLAICPDPNACNVSNKSKVQDLNDAAGSAQTLATVGYVVGGVGVAAGVTLFILSSGAKTEKSPAAAFQVQPWIGLNSAGVSGRF
jgi:hypothetical protein